MSFHDDFTCRAFKNHYFIIMGYSISIITATQCQVVELSSVLEHIICDVHIITYVFYNIYILITNILLCNRY